LERAYQPDLKIVKEIIRYAKKYCSISSNHEHLQVKSVMMDVNIIEKNKAG